MEAAGVSFLSVHGRTKEQRNQPVNLDAIRLIRENLNIPVVANGDIKSMDDVGMVYEATGVQGSIYDPPFFWGTYRFAHHRMSVAKVFVVKGIESYSWKLNICHMQTFSPDASIFKVKVTLWLQKSALCLFSCLFIDNLITEIIWYSI